MSAKITNFKGLDQNISNQKSVTEKRPQTDFQSYSDHKEAPRKVKTGVFFTTLAGVLAAMAFTFKAHKMPFKTPKEFFNSLIKIKYDSKNKEVEKLVGRLAIGSVSGGLIGGAIFDKKENMKAKYREAIIQLVGNIGTPLLCVAGGMRLFNKYEPQMLNKMKFLKGKMTVLPKVIASGISLVAGIFLGNKVGNVINENVFKVKDNRKIKLADMSPHIDDACLAVSLVAAESKFGPIISRVIPAALMVAGVSTGIAQEKPERLVTESKSKTTLKKTYA